VERKKLDRRKEYGRIEAEGEGPEQNEKKKKKLFPASYPIERNRSKTTKYEKTGTRFQKVKEFRGIV